MKHLCIPTEHVLHRRRFLGGLLSGGAASLSLPGVSLAADLPAAEQLKKQQKRVLFLWLAGGSSQFEMWDPKPGRETGGPFRAIQTAVSGYQVCELMPRLATRMNKLAVVRSLNTKISEHFQAADLMSSGWPKEAALEHPEIGVVLAKELALQGSKLPDYVSLFTTSEGRRRPSPGFLSRRHAPLLLEGSLRPSNIELPAGLSDAQHLERDKLRAAISLDFAQQRVGDDLVQGYNEAYSRVRGLMSSDELFDLEKEPTVVRERYGRTPFGRHCLLARRLLEAGVPVVKVARGFWDSHHDNFESHRELVPDFDNVLSVLLDDLDERGLLSSTLVIVLSEFGRTPKINQDVGRDHFADAWSCAFAGCGIRGGVIHGETNDDGTAVKSGEASAADVAATIFAAVGIDPQKHYQVGQRPVPLAKEDSSPIKAVLS
ncbi:DUF1501 domain-containing protein [Anatilimnocola floriformis]|uniref:DUF1501 domain-containing protein n=1 Tax=Anatilimnocola floriformis TaxID=2948575 RepID=UPI0020C34E55|nr:DUF1501 domain-containing protein [Anatilimnocola floriformis]